MQQIHRNKTPLPAMILALFVLLSTASLSAKELRIESFSPASNDLTARTNARLDHNGEKCALVKVALPIAGCGFSGAVGDAEFDVNEYLVYLPAGATGMTITPPGYQPLDVRFGEVSDVRSVQPASTYRLRLSGYENGSKRNESHANYLIMSVTPSSAVVEIDGRKYTPLSGTVKAFLETGAHSYTVEENGFETRTGTVTIGPDEPTTIDVTLRSIKSTLRVWTKTLGSNIKINDLYGGTNFWTGELPAGLYHIEVSAIGYYPYSEDIILGDLEEKEIHVPELDPITGSVAVSFFPVGATIMINGNEVGRSPLVVEGVPVGSHDIIISKPGFDYMHATALVEENKLVSCNGMLIKQSAGATGMKSGMASSLDWQSSPNSIYSSHINSAQMIGEESSFSNHRGKGQADKKTKNGNEHESVDLGLPSKTLWATRNMGAEKDYQKGSEYLLRNSAVRDYLKIKGAYSKSDSIKESSSSNRIILENLKDDYVKNEWGEKWSVPTRKNIEELINNCKFEYYNGGVKVIGPNGNWILIPVGQYWSNYSDAIRGIAFIMQSGVVRNKQAAIVKSGEQSISDGFLLRPVIKQK